MAFDELITPIDLERWPRRSHYEFFRDFDQPFFDVSSRVDLTPLVQSDARDEFGLFATMIHTALRAANATEALRLRFRGDQVYRIEQNQASFTVLGDNDLFNYATALFDADLSTFSDRIRKASADSRSRQQLYLEDDRRPDLVYITCLPWLDFQSIRHPMPGDPDDCAPRIAWGKIGPNADGRFEASLQLTVHHALADGVHAATFFREFEQRVDAFNP